MASSKNSKNGSENFSRFYFLYVKVAKKHKNRPIIKKEKDNEGKTHSEKRYDKTVI